MSNSYLAQLRYKVGTNTPNFDALSSLSWLAKRLVFAHQSCQNLKMAKNYRLNYLNGLLNLVWFLWWKNCLFWHQNRQMSDCTFLFLSTLEYICFHLCYRYLWSPQTLPHEQHNAYGMMKMRKWFKTSISRNSGYYRSYSYWLWRIRF